jgi:hypothetical protein
MGPRIHRHFKMRTLPCIETSGSDCPMTRCYIPEEWNRLRLQRCEDSKTRCVKIVFMLIVEVGEHWALTCVADVSCAVPTDVPWERIGWLLWICFCTFIFRFEHFGTCSSLINCAAYHHYRKFLQRVSALCSSVARARCRNVWRRCWNVCVGNIRISRGSLLFYSPSTPSLSPSDGLQLSSWVVSLFHCLVNLSVRKYFISYTWTGDCIGLC